ncbi:hypothetical protein [Streptomyces fildesensis]|uniref:hypothetical protein n=1 Tax=Streptomyces fildesensis TaxID=375757 RepID=UPI0018DEF1F7|nr:hypothetical protein [Streptomyces fildesensis]
MSTTGRPIKCARQALDTPQDALRWLLDRLDRIAAQADPPQAHPIRGWIDDPGQHSTVLRALVAGEDVAVSLSPDGDALHHVLTLQQPANRNED